MRVMSDDSSSIDEAEFLSAYGDPIGDCAIWAADERSEAGWMEVQSLATAIEENGWADYYEREDGSSEGEAHLSITERAEAFSDGQPVPGAFPGKVMDDNLPSGILARGASAEVGLEGLEGLAQPNNGYVPVPIYPAFISEGTDVLRAEENPWDIETLISRVIFEPPLQGPINVDIRQRATTNGIAQPTGGKRLSAISFDGAAFNHRSERDEAGLAPHSDTPDDAHSPPGHKKSKKRRKNGKPSSKQEHRKDQPRAQGSSSRAAEPPRRHGPGGNGRNGPRLREETPPPPTSSRSRNRGRDHSGSKVHPDSGSGSAHFDIPSPRIDSNESHLYRGFCWGWKPSWWPESW